MEEHHTEPVLSESALSLDTKMRAKPKQFKPWCTTSAKLLEVVFQWTIENFLFVFHSKQTGYKLESTPFFAEEDENIKWCLYLHPKGRDEGSKNFISLFLCLVSSDRQSDEGVVTKFEFSIIDETGTSSYSQSSSVETFVEPFEGKGYNTFMASDQVENFLCHGNLLISCRVQYQFETVTSSGGTKHILKAPPQRHVTHHLDNLLTTGQFSDITFNVNGREFHAHKLILVSRSPIFAAIFQHDMKGRLLDYLEVEDIRPEVFQQVLRFIYTDRVDNMATLAEELLAASEKYLLDMLKFECEQFLADHLSMKNCLEILKMAALNSAVRLKEAAIAFIRPRIVFLISTSGWKKLKETRPDLIVEFFESGLSP